MDTNLPPVEVQTRKPDGCRPIRYRLVCGNVIATMYFHSYMNEWYFNFTRGVCVDEESKACFVAVANIMHQLAFEGPPLDFQI